MKRIARFAVATAALAGVGLGSIGCQTYQMGQVMPSGYHMRDDLEYFPKGPSFPLANELAAMQVAEAEQAAPAQ